MAYSVNWATKVVTVPKADLTVISASPEIYQLDVSQFWANIHGIQDDVAAMPYPDIMRSNAPVVLSGVTYARSVEIINGYRIEFENGAYQVNLVGANNNLIDARVQNNVSLTSSNSGGLVQGGAAAADVWRYLIEGVFSAEELMRVFASALAGKISGGNTATETIRSVTDSKDRIVATVDASGNRTAVTLDVT
jgi:hypothetical protein